ncbi:MAG: hypothetical protein A3F09_00150 [Chlamydiae bacterium RIFCSPHIGHO2_12_FULL_49_11]|nr:MAG: hypothetical protein A3F09_00150 [Chlamydiae bacterium RIFCSPHIGHO2_12_FULL_49_11]
MNNIALLVCTLCLVAQNKAPEDEVVQKLSPMYQKVYIYALDDQQKKQVTAFTKKGQSPYAAIDAILARNRKANEKDPSKNLTPAERAMKKKDNSYIIMKQ